MYDGRLRAGDTFAYGSHNSTAQTAWLCHGGAVAYAWSPVIRHVYDSLTGDELLSLVAYAEPIG